MSEDKFPMLMTLSEVADHVGLSVETLAHYKLVGLIKPAVFGHKALYGSEALLRLEVIAKAKKLGFPLSEIKALVEANSKPEETRYVL